ncbi:MAG: glycoside hydrolase family 3 N-terminal domain-containing protein, partial [Chloroflexota bacterium]
MSDASFVFRDPTQPVDVRVDDLIARMALEEKVAQMVHDTPAIERLGVPAYNYWNEALHGVARAGLATVFPQAISLAAMWDTSLMHRVATVISDEGRAKHHAATRLGAPTAYTGLTFWSPNINIFRDPRWGRGHETYGEDPYLTARLGVAFIKGLQGDDPTYLKAAACAKHYAVHSGPEAIRFEFNAVVSAKDLRETYLPAFQAAVCEAGVETVMGAYNQLYGVPCCASELLLQRILREEWGFDGHVVSDCGAIDLFHRNYSYTATPEEAVARAVRAGCDLN